MSRRLVPALVVVVLLLAGCSGGTSNQPTGSPSANGSPEASATGLPPGVDETGVTNASALAAAHHRVLLEEGFVANRTYVTDLENQGVQREQIRRLVGPDADRFASVIRIHFTATNDPNATVVDQSVRKQWVNDTMSVLHGWLDDGRNYTTTLRDPPSPQLLTRSPYLEADFERLNLSVESTVTRDGRSYTTLVANETVGENGTNQTRTYRFRVDARGVVHLAQFSVDGDSGRDSMRTRIVELGVSPTPPDWVPEYADEADETPEGPTPTPDDSPDRPLTATPENEN